MKNIYISSYHHLPSKLTYVKRRKIDTKKSDFKIQDTVHNKGATTKQLFFLILIKNLKYDMCKRPIY